MNQAFLLLGSNLGDRKETLEKAIAKIEQKAGKAVKISSLYETEPWGFECEEPFINQVIEIETLEEVNALLCIVLSIEKELGRERKSGQYESRTIDIDILFYNDEIIKTEELTIPHPRIHERRFTLVPLQEINATFVHPEFKKTISDLLEECSDNSNVDLINN